MSAKCRVCHRPLKNAAHAAAGIGPTCAANVARRASVTDGRAAYPAAKLARLAALVAKTARWLREAQEYQAAARRSGTPEQQARGEWLVRLTTHWYGRVRMLQMAAQRTASAR